MGGNLLDFGPSNHEAAHAVFAALMGVPIDGASIGLQVHDGEDLLGLVRVRHIASRRGLRRGLAAVVAPSVAVGRPIPYPPRAEHGGDELAASIIVGILEMSAGEYALVVHSVEELLSLQFVRNTLAHVSGELRERGSLTGSEVQSIVFQHAGPPPSPSFGGEPA